MRILTRSVNGRIVARYSFYELAGRRTEADGSVRRCFHASDDSGRALFIWQSRDELDADITHAQLLLGDETYVEWRAAQVSAGVTNRAGSDTSAHSQQASRGQDASHSRHKGVRTLERSDDEGLLVRAQLLLSDSNLPVSVVDVLLARLRAAP